MKLQHACVWRQIWGREQDADQLYGQVWYQIWDEVGDHISSQTWEVRDLVEDEIFVWI